MVADRLVSVPDIGTSTIDQLYRDFESGSPWVRKSVCRVLSRRLARQITPADVEIRVHKVDENDIRVESNLSTRFALQEEAAYYVVQEALIAVGGMNHRLEQMRVMEGVSGCQEDDLNLFDDKLAFLAAQFDPNAQEGRFGRVLEIADLPDASMAEPGAIDVETLLQIRASDECRALRLWLRQTDGRSDGELRDSFHAVREALARCIGSRRGRAARFAVSGGLSFIPGAGLIAGPAASAVDTFLIDRVVGKPGPYSFLSHDYPSIFKGR